MEIDHIFIFSDQQGHEANELVDFGFVEGSSRVHPGQGTVNRKFYFENFFLEILWVEQEDEIKSTLTAPTQLWERSQFKHNSYAPFGLCLVNTEDTDALFQQAQIYQPDYFPEGMSIDMLTNHDLPYLPWTFRLPFKDPKKKTDEPTQHQNGLKKLTKATFGINQEAFEGSFTNFFQNIDHISFEYQSTHHLTLQFDQGEKNQKWECKALNLSIEY